jgi:hypothetical protein
MNPKGSTDIVRFWYEEQKTSALNLYSCDGGATWTNRLDISFHVANEEHKLRIAAAEARPDEA